MARPTYRVIVIIFLIAFGAIWLGYRQTFSPPKPIEEVFESGTLTIGIDASFPPFAVDDGTSLYGIDIDVGKAIAEYLGLEVRFVNMGFDGLYDSLLNGQVDILISALTLDPSKTDTVIYTRGYFDNGLVLVSQQGSDINYFRDLANRSLALEYGSYAHSRANYWLRRSETYNIRPYELPEIALDAVRLDEAQAALVNTTSLLLYQYNHSDWDYHSSRVNSTFYLIAVRHDRPDAYRWIDHAVAELQTAGHINAIVQQWFSSLAN